MYNIYIYIIINSVSILLYIVNYYYDIDSSIPSKFQKILEISVPSKPWIQAHPVPGVPPEHGHARRHGVHDSDPALGGLVRGHPDGAADHSWL